VCATKLWGVVVFTLPSFTLVAGKTKITSSWYHYLKAIARDMKAEGFITCDNTIIAYVHNGVTKLRENPKG
jgi:hypothetical protein